MGKSEKRAMNGYQCNLSVRQIQPKYRFRWYISSGKQKERHFNVSDYGSKRDAHRAARKYQKKQASVIAMGSLKFLSGCDYFELRWHDGSPHFRSKKFPIHGNTKAEKLEAYNNVREFMKENDLYFVRKKSKSISSESVSDTQ